MYLKYLLKCLLYLFSVCVEYGKLDSFQLEFSILSHPNSEIIFIIFFWSAKYHYEGNK